MIPKAGSTSDPGQQERAVFLTCIRRTIRLTILGASIVLATIPAFAQHSVSPTHLFKDPDAKAYRNRGLPCSTTSISGSFAPKLNGGLRELDHIERASVNAIKSSSDRGNGGRALLYHPLFHSERQPAINFIYHAPAAGLR